MNYVSADHIILTPTQPIGSGRPERRLNLESPDEKSHALPPEADLLTLEVSEDCPVPQRLHGAIIVA